MSAVKALSHPGGRGTLSQLTGEEVGVCGGWGLDWLEGLGLTGCGEFVLRLLVLLLLLLFAVLLGLPVTRVLRGSFHVVICKTWLWKYLIHKHENIQN